MTYQLSSIISSLAQQKAAIDKALSALRGLDNTPPDWVTDTTKPGGGPRRGRKRSAALRKRMQEAQRLRWARTKGEATATSEPKTPAKKQRTISPEGMKRIIAAQKKRWAAERAETKATKKAP